MTRLAMRYESEILRENDRKSKHPLKTNDNQQKLVEDSHHS